MMNRHEDKQHEREEKKKSGKPQNSPSGEEIPKYPGSRDPLKTYKIPSELAPVAEDWELLINEFDVRCTVFKDVVRIKPWARGSVNTAFKILINLLESFISWLKRAENIAEWTDEKIAEFEEIAQVLKTHAITAFHVCERAISPEYYDLLDGEEADAKWKEENKRGKAPEFTSQHYGRAFSLLTWPQRAVWLTSLGDAFGKALPETGAYSLAESLSKLYEKKASPSDGPENSQGPDVGHHRAGINKSLFYKVKNEIIPPLEVGHFNSLYHSQQTGIRWVTSEPLALDSHSWPGGAVATPVPQHSLPSSAEQAAARKEEKKSFHNFIVKLEKANANMNFHGGTILVTPRGGNETLHSVFDLPDFRGVQNKVLYDPSFTETQMDILNLYREYGFAIRSPVEDANLKKIREVATAKINSFISISNKLNSTELNINKFVEKYVQDAIDEFDLQDTFTPKSKLGILSPGERVGQTRSDSLSLTELSVGMHYRTKGSSIFWWPSDLPEAFKNKIVPTGVLNGLRAPDKGVFTRWENQLDDIKKTLSSADMETFYEFSFAYSAQKIIKTYNATESDLIYKFARGEIKPELVIFSGAEFGETFLKDTIMLRRKEDNYCIIMNVEGDYDTYYLDDEIHKGSKLRSIIMKGLPVKYQWKYKNDVWFKSHKKHTMSSTGMRIKLIPSPIKPGKSDNYKKELAEIALFHLEDNMKSLVVTAWENKIPDVIEAAKWFASLALAIFPPTSILGALGLIAIDSTVTIIGGVLKATFSRLADDEMDIFYETLIELAFNRLSDLGMPLISRALPKSTIRYKSLLKDHFEKPSYLKDLGQVKSSYGSTQHHRGVDANTKLEFGKDLYNLDPDYITPLGAASWDSVVNYQYLSGLIDKKALDLFTQVQVKPFDYIGFMGDQPALIRNFQELQAVPAGTRLGIVGIDDTFLKHTMLKSEGGKIAGINNDIIGAGNGWREVNLNALIDWSPGGAIKFKATPGKEYLLYSQNGELTGMGIPDNVKSDARFIKGTGLIPHKIEVLAPGNSVNSNVVQPSNARPPTVGKHSKLPIEVTKHNNLLVINTADTKCDTALVVSHGGFTDNSGVIKVPDNFQLKFATPHNTVLSAPASHFFSLKEFRYFTKYDNVNKYKIYKFKDLGEKFPVPLEQLKQEIYPNLSESVFRRIFTKKSTKDRLLATGTHKKGHIRNYDLDDVTNVYSIDSLVQVLDHNRALHEFDQSAVKNLYPNGVKEKFDIITPDLDMSSTTQEVIDFARQQGYTKLKFIHCRIYDTIPSSYLSVNTVQYIADPTVNIIHKGTYKNVLSGDLTIDLVHNLSTFEVKEPIHWLLRPTTSRQNISVRTPLPMPSSVIQDPKEIKDDLYHKHANYTIRSFNVYNSVVNTTTRFILPLSEDLDGRYRVINSMPIKGLSMGGRFIVDRSYEEVNHWMSDFMHEHGNSTLWFSFKDFNAVSTAISGDIAGVISLEQSYFNSMATPENNELSNSAHKSLFRDESSVINFLDNHVRKNIHMMRIIADATSTPRGIPPSGSEVSSAQHIAIKSFLQELGFRVFSREVEYWQQESEETKSSFFVTIFSDSHNNYIFDPHIYWALATHPGPSDITSLEPTWLGKVFLALRRQHFEGHYRNVDGNQTGTWSSI